VSSFALQLDTATFVNPVKGLRLPSRYKLAGEYILGGSQAETIVNHANPSAPMTVQGSPTYNANSVIVRSSLTAGFGFKTGLIPNDDATLIVVRKNASIASSPLIVSTPPTDAPFGMLQFGSNNYAANGEVLYGLGAKRPTPASASEVYFEALVMSARNVQRGTGGYGKMYYYSGSTQVEVVSTDLRSTSRNLVGELCIGSNLLQDTITNNNLEVYFVALYQRPLSGAELGVIKTQLTSYYATLGITLA
jgi:hypothetical protein